MTCESNFQPCADGTECRQDIEFCDGYPDCADRSDENNCETFNSTLTGRLKCKDGKQYVPAHQFCDGYEQCRDGSDERHCEACHDDKVKMCADGSKCIDLSKFCDGTTHCGDGSDEKDCDEVTCPTDWQQCGDKRQCYKKRSRCDRNLNCTDGSDEMFCACKTDKACALGLECINGRCYCTEKEYWSRSKNKLCKPRRGRGDDCSFVEQCESGYDCMIGHCSVASCTIGSCLCPFNTSFSPITLECEGSKNAPDPLILLWIVFPTFILLVISVIYYIITPDPIEEVWVPTEVEPKQPDKQENAPVMPFMVVESIISKERTSSLSSSNKFEGDSALTNYDIDTKDFSSSYREKRTSPKKLPNWDVPYQESRSQSKSMKKKEKLNMINWKYYA